MNRITMTVLAGVAAVLAVPAAAQQIPGPYGPAVTLAQARGIVDAARSAAEGRGFRMAFAVALPSGEPILLEVMDGTQSASIVVSQAKARAAARYRRPTKAFDDAIKAGNVGLTTLPDVIANEGGVPIVADGRVIGALGVSGGTSAEDGEIARAALGPFKPR